jgi:hypothetical protein
MDDAHTITRSLKTLGLTELPSDKTELKTAFRCAAKSSHPDAGGTQELFTEVNEAYKFLVSVVNGDNLPLADIRVLMDDGTTALIESFSLCPDCFGESKTRTCPSCHGLALRCSVCRGLRTVSTPCPTCLDTKLIKTELRVDFEQLRSGRITIRGMPHIVSSVK